MEKPLKNPWFHGWSTGLGSTLAFGIQLLEMAMDAMEREMVKPGFRIFPWQATWWLIPLLVSGL